MIWIILAAIAVLGYFAIQSQFKTLYFALVVDDQDIVTASVDLVELAKTSAQGNRVAVRDDPGIRVSTAFVGSDLHFYLVLDVGVSGVRITKSWDLNVGSPTRFTGKGQTFVLMESPIPVEVDIRVGK